MTFIWIVRTTALSEELKLSKVKFGGEGCVWWKVGVDGSVGVTFIWIVRTTALSEISQGQ